MFEAEFDKDHNLVKVPKDDGPGVSPANQEEAMQEETKQEDIVKYEALSWRWGDEAKGKYAVMIHKDGALYRKRVSKTLGLALKYLRFETERLIWIDALCIN
jgi:hypothetical protein